LPDLLNEILNGGIGEKVLVDLAVAPSRQVFDEMIGFLASGPTREQIVAYKISDAAQTRLRELLDKNREDGLSEDESALRLKSVNASTSERPWSNECRESFYYDDQSIQATWNAVTSGNLQGRGYPRRRQGRARRRDTG